MKIPKGYTLRPIQEDVLSKINHTFNLLNLPTGSGKSLIAETLSLNHSATVITKTKFLQDQYLNEFFYTNLKGKDNYICNYGYRWQTLECYLKLNQTKKKCIKNCPYQIAKNQFKESKKRLTNFAYLLKSPWIDECPTEYMIIDEAHNFPGEIINATRIEYNPNNELLKWQNYKDPKGISALVYLSKIEEFINNLEEVNKISVEKIVFELKQLLKHSYPESTRLPVAALFDIYKPKEMALFIYVKKFIDKIKLYQNIIFLKWKEDDTYILSPVYPKDVIELWKNKAHKFILMTATIGKKEYFEEELGISNSFYFEADSPFKVENRPIIYKPVYNFTYRTKDESIQKMIPVINNVIQHHPNQNGIIHTPSFSLAWEIKKRSKYGNNMVIPKNPLDVKNYMNKGKIIVGPNFYEGVDFKDDNARWQIITKIPYMELTNPYIKYRLENDKHWYTNETLKRLEQTIGRIVRNENDWGVTYIFDKQFERFINLFPRFIKNAIKRV